MSEPATKHDQNSKPLLTAIVLAGGQSSRMGQDKALISIHGVPLLRRVCEVALHCTDAVYVVTAWPEHYTTIVPSQCKLIQEPQPDRPPGPLVGFAHALTQVQSVWVLLLACDLPRLQPEVLLSWIDRLPAATETALLPKGDRGWEPLCGFYRTSCLPSLQRAIVQGDRSFQGWLAGETVGELQVSDRSLLFNCNTPADLRQLEQLPQNS
ncbi:MAG TPA: molybdenum cofactor guanylyltransferase [Thermosynechococcaceae cyanobacterium]